MPRWHRNEPIAANRRATLFIETIDGEPAPATTSFTGTNELLVDQGDGEYVAAGGTLSNKTLPLVFADQTFTADAGTDVITTSGTAPETGSGPFQLSTTAADLPLNLAVATDYWFINTGASTGKLATSLANALAGVAVDIGDAGTGVHTISDTADTKQLCDGEWIYEASQAEIDYRGTYFAIRIAKTDFKTYVLNVDLDDERQMYAGVAQGGAAGTMTLDAGASATNDFYKDMIAVIVGGTGRGQVSTVSSYAGGTKVATMARNWAVNPDNTSQFVLVPAPSGANPSSVADAVWAEVLEDAHTAGDLMRLIVGIFAGAVTDYTTNTFVFKSLNGAKTRVTITADETGRTSNPTIGDLT